jgi:hypothetical protein
MRYANDKKLIFFERRFIMPGGDRTGPMGMGPMTGRGMGFCASNPAAGYMNRMGGCGFGRGGGRGWRNRFFATGLPGWARAGGFQATNSTPPTQQELDVLKQQAQYLQDSLGQINSRIEQLEKE